MKIPWKLATIVLLMVIPLAVTLGLFVRDRQQVIANQQTELDTVAYTETVAALLTYIPQHRGTAAGFLGGDRTQRTRLTELAAQVDQAFANLEALNPTLGTGLGAVDTVSQIASNWTALKQQYERLTPADSFARHTAVIQQVLDLLEFVADQGQLVNPDVANAFLIDVLVIRVPEVAEALGVLRGLGNGIAARQLISLDERGRLAELTSAVAAGLDSIERGLRAAFKGDPELESQLSAKLATAKRESIGFANLATTELIDAEVIDIIPTNYFDTGTSAITQIYDLGDNTRNALRSALQSRQSTNRNQRNTQVAVAVGLTLLAGLLAFIFSRGITRQVGAIGDLFGQIGIGDFEARAEVVSKDELGEMASNLNSMLNNTLTLIQSQAERDKIQTSIFQLLEEISGVADGDLTAEAEVTAEITGAIADAFNQMISQLREIISNVQDTTLQVSTASSEIQTTAEHLAVGSENQSEQIINTSSAIEEMAVSIQQVSENAASASRVAEEALENAKDGSGAVSRTISGMNNIRQQVQETSKRIKRLGESSQEIGEIVQLIGDIADRTSILALNASIQAASAGEAGRGFAVVAEEVERLADRSAEATKRIEGLIKTIQSETIEAVAAMEDTTREVVGGSNVANEAGQALTQIEGVSNRLAELIGSISMASKQQARGSESVSVSMTDISEITQQTAAGTKQAAQSIRRLADLADELRDSISAFKLPGRAA